MQVEVWSDVVCPWCYIGKRRFEAALREFPHPVEVAWRSYELDPNAPRVRPDDVSQAERLAKKYMTSLPQAQQMIDRVVEVGRGEALELRLNHAKTGNTFDAHRLLHLARERGIQGAVKERFFRGYMTEGEAIGEPETLARLATDAGLDEQDARSVLGSNAFAAEVRADETRARELGISGVPFFVIGRFAVSGAQPAGHLLGALQRAQAEVRS